MDIDEASGTLHDTKEDAHASEHRHTYHKEIDEEVFTYISEHPESSTLDVMDNLRSRFPSQVIGALYRLCRENRLYMKYSHEDYCDTWSTPEHRDKGLR